MAEQEALEALESEMGVLVRRIRRVIAKRAQMVHPDISPVSYSMLIALRDGGPLRASDLVEMFSIDKGAVSRHLQTMDELGLIERRTDPADRRAAILTITEEAKRRLAAVSAKRREELGRRLSEWGDGELESFVAALTRYNATLDQLSR